MEQRGETPNGAERWFACRTRSRAEKRVERLLVERGIDAYLPLVQRKRQWADRRTTVEFPLFPGYVFGRFDPARIHAVLSTTSVTTVVRMAGRPAPIRDEEIDNIRRLAGGLAETRQEPEPEPFATGDWVRVTGGPFDGLEALVTELRGGRHVLAGLRTVGQGIVVFIESGRLSPIPAPPLAAMEPAEARSDPTDFRRDP